MLTIDKHEARVAYKCSNNTSSCVLANLFPVARVIALWLAVHIITLQLVQYLDIAVKYCCISIDRQLLSSHIKLSNHLATGIVSSQWSGVHKCWVWYLQMGIEFSCILLSGVLHSKGSNKPECNIPLMQFSALWNVAFLCNNKS